MNSKNAVAVILKRMNYGEADRILTVLTRDSGRLSLMAKGVRRSTSKLAGGIELFSESSIQYIKGRGEIGTLVSARILNYYGNIVLSLEASTTAYSVLSITEKITEHSDGPEYYDLLVQALFLLNTGYDPKLVIGLFYVRLLSVTGHDINVQSDIYGNKFEESKTYQYNFDKNAFEIVPFGYESGVVKVVKALSLMSLSQLRRIRGVENNLEDCLRLLETMLSYYLNIKISDKYRY